MKISPAKFISLNCLPGFPTEIPAGTQWRSLCYAHVHRAVLRYTHLRIRMLCLASYPFLVSSVFHQAKEIPIPRCWTAWTQAADPSPQKSVRGNIACDMVAALSVFSLLPSSAAAQCHSAQYADRAIKEYMKAVYTVFNVLLIHICRNWRVMLFALAMLLCTSEPYKFFLFNFHSTLIFFQLLISL